MLVINLIFIDLTQIDKTGFIVLGISEEIL